MIGVDDDCLQNPLNWNVWMRKLPLEVTPNPSPESPGLLRTIEPDVMEIGELPVLDELLELDAIEDDIGPRVREPDTIVRTHPVE